MAGDVSVPRDVLSEPWVTRAYLVSEDEWDPVPELRVHPPDARSGIPEVDRAIELVLAGDVEGLAALAAIGAQPCETQDYSPPCRDGEEPGAPVEVFTYGACHGGFAYPADVEAPFARFLGLPVSGPTIAVPLRLFSVERVVPEPAAHRTAYELRFSFPDGTARSLPLQRDGMVPALFLGCFHATPIDRYSTTEHEWVIAPP